jgi:hypothetical protein
MPQPRIRSEKFIKNKRGQLCELVQALCLEIGTVDIFVKAMVPYLVQPTSEVLYEPCLGSRKIQGEQQDPQYTEHQPRTDRLAFLRTFMVIIK